MPDPVPNTEVEDVLASIRRLVSDETSVPKPAAVAQPSVSLPDMTVPNMAEDKPVKPGRLVLTPALRVDTPELDQSETFAQPDEADIARWEKTLDFLPKQKEAADSLRTAAETQEANADQNADVPQKPEALQASNLQLNDGIAEPAEPTFAHRDINLEVDADKSDSVDAEPKSEKVTPITLSAKIAALEAVIGKRDDEYEPDGIAQDAYSGSETPTISWEDHVPEDVPSSVVHHEPELLEAEPVPDDEDEEDDSDTAAIEDVVETVSETAVEDASNDLVNGVAEGISGDETLLDEDTLRDLITDIVREELQGSLGERITRNVRKLVRREIQRALAVQDLS